MKSAQQGFALPLVIIIIAALGVGGGVYYSQKAKVKNEAKQEVVISGETQVEGEISNKKNDPQSSLAIGAKSSVSANTQAPNNVSGAIKMDVTLQELLSYNKGKNVMCKGTTTTKDGTTIATTTYVNGEIIRGDSIIVHNGVTTKSSMILKDSALYSWTGSQGIQMTGNANFDLNAVFSIENFQNQTAANQKAEYACSPWIPDTSKFIVPTSVQFTNYGSVNFPSVSPEMIQKMMEGKSGY